MSSDTPKTPAISYADDLIVGRLSDNGIREVYADDAASMDKLPYSDIPINAPSNFQDFLGNLNTGTDMRAKSYPYDPERTSKVIDQQKEMIKEQKRIARQLEVSGLDVDVKNLEEFSQVEAARIRDDVPTDGGQYEPKGTQKFNPRSSTPVEQGGSPYMFSNHNGSPHQHRNADSHEPNTTAAAYRPDGTSLNNVVPPRIRDEMLANLIAGRTAAYIQRLLKVKYSFIIDSGTINHCRKVEPWKSIIVEGRKLRYDAVRSEGLALIDERILTLAHNAEQLQLRIDEVMSTGGIPPVQLMKELRETLGDIADELGHRRKGIDLDNNMMVSVIRGPVKAASRDAWESTARQVELQEAEDGTFSSQQDSEPPQAS